MTFGHPKQKPAPHCLHDNACEFLPQCAWIRLNLSSGVLATAPSLRHGRHRPKVELAFS